MLRGFAVASVAATLAFAGGISAPQTGLHGKLCAGSPPPSGAAAACTKPMRGVLVFSRIDIAARSRSVRTGVNGGYEIALPPGRYRVGLPFRIGITPRRLRPSMVVVHAGRNDRVDFYLVPGSF